MPTKRNLSKRHSKREARPRETKLQHDANEETTREAEQADVFTLSPAARTQHTVRIRTPRVLHRTIPLIAGRVWEYSSTNSSTFKLSARANVSAFVSTSSAEPPKQTTLTVEREQRDAILLLEQHEVELVNQQPYARAAHLEDF